MLADLTKASADQASKKVYGFDDKMVIAPGFKFSFGQNEQIYTEFSGFKRENPDTKEMENVDTLFVAREENGKVIGLNLATLMRSAIPSGGVIQLGGQYHSTYVQGTTYPPVVTGKKTAAELVASLAGRTIELLAIVPYKATSAKGKPYDGKQYVWKFA